jgi:DNA-binding response OmpR family regulator
MPSARGTILVVEDEPAIRDLLRLHLGLAQFDVREEANGRRALDTARAERFALIILDVMLPGLDGVTLCRALRSEGASRDTPMLMLTARDAESDKVVGLESGADDYVAKPFGIRELLARVEALLRRHKRAGGESAPADTYIAAGELAIDVQKRQVTVRGAAVDLTRQEFDLLILTGSPNS